MQKLENGYAEEKNLNMPEKIEKNLPEKLKRFRKSSGLSTIEVGKALNKTPSTVTMWEKGKSVPDIATLFKLVKLYNLPDLNSFFNEDEPTNLKSLTQREQELITLWRSSPSSVRASIKNLLKHCNK